MSVSGIAEIMLLIEKRLDNTDMSGRSQKASELDLIC